jgi:hypothetical protein
MILPIVYLWISIQWDVLLSMWFLFVTNVCTTSIPLELSTTLKLYSNNCYTLVISWRNMNLHCSIVNDFDDVKEIRSYSYLLSTESLVSNCEKSCQRLLERHEYMTCELHWLSMSCEISFTSRLDNVWRMKRSAYMNFSLFSRIISSHLPLVNRFVKVNSLDNYVRHRSIVVLLIEFYSYI